MKEVEKRAFDLFISNIKHKAYQNLKSNGRGVWSGKLLESIKLGNIQKDSDRWLFTINMEDYGEFIDQGVNGIKKSWGSKFSYSNKKPPIDKIKPWAMSKGLNPFAVQTNIFKNGIKPTKFFENAYESEYDKFLETFIEAQTQILLDQFGED